LVFRIRRRSHHRQRDRNDGWQKFQNPIMRASPTLVEQAD
jgi:hypothetical protein